MWQYVAIVFGISVHYPAAQAIHNAPLAFRSELLVYIQGRLHPGVTQERLCVLHICAFQLQPGGKAPAKNLPVGYFLIFANVV
jgi:hypothetical protein